MVAFILIFSFFLLVLLVGFPIAVPLFVFLYTKIYGKEKWWLSAGVAAGAWAGFYILFVLISNMHFGDGWIQQGLRAIGII